MNVNFRNEARKALGRAKFELDTKQQDRLIYAALELRMAMEALAYDRAHAYKAKGGALASALCREWRRGYQPGCLSAGA